MTSKSCALLADVTSTAISFVVVASTCTDALRFCSVSVLETATKLLADKTIPLTLSWILQVPEVVLAAIAKSYCLLIAASNYDWAVAY